MTVSQSKGRAEPRDEPAGRAGAAGEPARRPPVPPPAPATPSTSSGSTPTTAARHVLKEIDVEFAASQVTAIIGPSGSGKSTLIRCVNRMHELAPGARVGGQGASSTTWTSTAPSVDVTAVRRHIGMVFQKPNPFPPCRSTTTWPPG